MPTIRHRKLREAATTADVEKVFSKLTRLTSSLDSVLIQLNDFDDEGYAIPRAIELIEQSIDKLDDASEYLASLLDEDFVG